MAIAELPCELSSRSPEIYCGEVLDPPFRLRNPPAGCFLAISPTTLVGGDREAGSVRVALSSDRELSRAARRGSRPGGVVGGCAVAHDGGAGQRRSATAQPPADPADEQGQRVEAEHELADREPQRPRALAAV